MDQYFGQMTKHVDVAVIGAGTAGLSAVAEVRKKTDSWVLIDGGVLGTTCARVGCMPSKAMIQIATDFDRRHICRRRGVEGTEHLSMNVPDAMESVRDLRDIFVDRVLEGTTDVMGDAFIEENACFVDAHTLRVGDDTVRADKIVVATGSRPIVPDEWKQFADKIITTDDIFEMEELPASMAVVGLGSIGLELGQALQRLGIDVVGVDVDDRLMGLSDPVVNDTAVEILGKELTMWLGHPVQIARQGSQLLVTAGERSARVDKILLSVGRRPNIDKLGLENLDVERGRFEVPVYDPGTMQIGDLPVFIAGDVTNREPVLHEASFEGRVAGSNAVADQLTVYSRFPPMSVTYTEPNIVNVGISYPQAIEDNAAIGEVRLGPVGRALIMGSNRGVIRVYADRENGTLRGASMIAARGEHLVHLLALAIQLELTVDNLLLMPFYHPSMEEGLQAALRDAQSQIQAAAAN